MYGAPPTRNTLNLLPCRPTDLRIFNRDINLLRWCPADDLLHVPLYRTADGSLVTATQRFRQGSEQRWERNRVITG